jgi:amino-acid N-acetyltransferase
VGEEAGAIVACVSLLYYTPELAEVRSLAVSDAVKGQGWGKAIVAAIIAKAEREQVPTLFALTRAVHFFEKAGFSVTEKDRFPEKVWRDCHICPLLHHCDETAVILRVIA